MVLWVGQQLSQEFVTSVFGVASYSQIDPDMVMSVHSTGLRLFLQVLGSYCCLLQHGFIIVMAVVICVTDL